MKVRSHLALTVVAAMVPLIVFSAIGLKMLLNAEREAALHGVHETVRATALAVDRELSNAESAMRVLAASQSLANEDLEAFYLQALASSQSADTWTVLFNRDGYQLINTQVPYGTKLPRRRIPENGLHVMQTRKPRVTDLVMGPVRQQPIVAMDVPVSLHGGQRYVLSQGFLPEYFTRVITQQPTPPNWIIGVVDRRGITIARSQRARDYVGKPTIPSLAEAMGTSTDGTIRTMSLDGIEIYAVYARSAVSGWTVAIGVPTVDIDRAAQRAVMLAVLGLLVAVICAGIVAVLFSRRLAQSIRGAERSAMALGRGEAPATIVSGVTEVDRLHGALAEAGELLTQERQSRQAAEEERMTLLAKEQEARRAADAENKAKDEFLAMLGHELRNPLGAITSAVTLMNAAGATAARHERARAIIERQSRHLAHIVDDLLDLSRIMTGKILLQKQHIDLGEAVTRCAETLRTTDIKQHVWHIAAEPVWVDADATRLEQMISNLIVNAIKYTPVGGSIHIALSEVAGEAVLEVRDSGIGIEPELLPNIFNIFVQGATSIDRAEGGMGIGLSLVRQLAVLHGGSVTASSGGMGQGSRFTLCLPTVSPLPSRKLLATPHRQPVPGKVLVIEDNADGREMLSALLSSYGYEVMQAENGMAGLAMAMASQPDIAIIDIGLPGISGYEVAQRLRESGTTRSMRLIALTGYGLEEDRQKAAQAGFDVHLAKPFDAARLFRALDD
jgi:signal transduction histidine kinase